LAKFTTHPRLRVRFFVAPGPHGKIRRNKRVFTGVYFEELLLGVGGETMKSWQLTLAVMVLLGLLSGLAVNIFPDKAYVAWTWISRQDRRNTLDNDSVGMMQIPPISPGSRSTVLPSTQAAAIMRLSSRVAPKVEETWQASEADIVALETNLQQISGLRCIWGTTSLGIVGPQSFFRQYVAIIVAGRQLIYETRFTTWMLRHSWRNGWSMFPTADHIFGAQYSILQPVRSPT
jgi:hypothetical protein